MKNIILIILSITFLSCNETSKNKVYSFKINEEDQNQLNYKTRKGLQKPIIEIIKEEYSHNYRIFSITKNNNILFYGYEKGSSDTTIYKLEPKISSTIIMPSEFTCDEKITFKQNEFEFTLCINEIYKYYDKQIEKSKTDVYYDGYKKRKNEIQNLISKKRSELDANLLYDLIGNVPVNVYDKFRKQRINKIIKNNCRTGWSGVNEYYFIDDKNDTIANFSYQKWVH